MKTQVIEGTFEDVQRIFCSLPLQPEVRLHLTITEDENAPIQKACSPDDSFLANAPRRNGMILLPEREISEPITLELIERLLDKEDEEALLEYRNAGY